MTTVLRPLTLGELLDRAFSLYRQHFVLFVGIAALPGLVLLSFRVVNVTLLRAEPGDIAGQLMSAFITLLMTFTLVLAVTAVQQAATTVAVSQLYLGRPATIHEAFQAIRGKFLDLAIITVCLTLLIIAGTMFFIVPGVLLLLRWSLAIPVAVLERTGLAHVMTRSADLSLGRRGRVLAILFLYYALVYIFSTALAAPVVIVAVMRGESFVNLPVWALVCLTGGGFVTESLIGPLVTIALTLLYYDARVRKEAFDIDHLMAQLTPATASPSTTG